MAAEYQLTFPYALLTALTLLGLVFTVLNDPYLVKRDRRLMLIWLAIWLQDLLRVKTDLKIPREKTGLSPVVNGQIVVNKGYAPKSEGLKPL